MWRTILLTILCISCSQMVDCSPSSPPRSKSRGGRPRGPKVDTSALREHLAATAPKLGAPRRLNQDIRTPEGEQVCYTEYRRLKYAKDKEHRLAGHEGTSDSPEKNERCEEGSSNNFDAKSRTWLQKAAIVRSEEAKRRISEKGRLHYHQKVSTDEGRLEYNLMQTIGKTGRAMRKGEITEEQAKSRMNAVVDQVADDNVVFKKKLQEAVQRNLLKHEQWKANADSEWHQILEGASNGMSVDELL